MRCCRWMLPVLALYLLMEEVSAAFLPSRSQNKREVVWPDHEHFSRLSEHTDFGDHSVGDVWERGRVYVEGRPSVSEPGVSPTDDLQTVQRHHQHQHQLHQRKANEKRIKVAPMDPIGSFQMSSFKTKKDEPGVDWEDYRD